MLTSTMKLLTLVLASLLASAHSVTAQVRTVTTPPGYGTTEAPTFADSLGIYADGRAQFTESFLRNSVKLIKQVGYRADYRSYTPFNSKQRKWSNVTLKIADSDVAKMSQTFSANYSSTPTLVFSGPIDWKKRPNGFPVSKPAPWNTEYAFPFSTSWPSLGVKDVVLDYRFSGGVQSNSAPWTRSDRLPMEFDSPYSRDRADSPNQGLSGRSTIGGRCADSGGKGFNIAFYSLDVRIYSRTHSTYPNQFEASMGATRFGAGSPVVHVLSPFGNVAGTVFPSLNCRQLLHLDLSKPFFTFFAVASRGADGFGSSSINLGRTTWTSAAAGTRLFAQAAWADSLNQELRLTFGCLTTITVQPSLLMRKSIDNWDGTQASGQAAPTMADSRNPLIQWSY